MDEKPTTALIPAWPATSPLDWGVFAHFEMLKRRFLAAYVRTGRITKAAEMAGVSPASHYVWIGNDPEYAKAFKDAFTMAGDMIEDEAVRRAVEGVPEGVWWRGERVGEETKRSDVLLMQQLNGRFPERYKYSRVDANINIRQLNITIANDDLPEGV